MPSSEVDIPGLGHLLQLAKVRDKTSKLQGVVVGVMETINCVALGTSIILLMSNSCRVW